MEQLKCKICLVNDIEQESQKCNNCKLYICKDCINSVYFLKDKNFLTCKSCYLSSLDFKVYNNPRILNGTTFFEIGKGKYNYKHWQEGNIFIEDETFTLIEYIFINHFPNLDHFGPNEIEKQIGVKVINEFKKLIQSNGSEFKIKYNIPDTLWEKHQKSFLELFIEIKKSLEEYYSSGDLIYILGI